MFTGLINIGLSIISAMYAEKPAVEAAISALYAEKPAVEAAQTPPLVEQVRYWPSVPFRLKSPIPQGYYNLCRSGNPICKATPARDVATDGTGAVALTDGLQSQLNQVNTQVNRSIRPLSDGRDIWRVNPKFGDCKDYALTKKQHLIGLGWPSSALVVAIARTATGVEHAVLIARTNRGDLVLDNLKETVRPWSPGLYQWQMVQSPVETWVWYKL